MDETTKQRFWSKVAVGMPNDCWPWLGSRLKSGYGQFFLDKRNKSVRSHRIAFELTNGPIPEGMGVCHKCDNPICVNPSHLFLGTQKDNLQDAARKGRIHNLRGEMIGVAKLTDKEVIEIRRLKQTGLSNRKIAKMFGVSHQAINDIISRKFWTHI